MRLCGKMDVTSLLNSAATAAHGVRKESVDQAATPSSLGGTTACSTAIPTPSPDETPSRRSSESRTPNRSRTPWDAGGYSLPLLDTKIRHATSTTKSAFYDESPVDNPGSESPLSPKHKFSDSHSSLSSYTFSSSTNSVSHSRISSLSTVSELQPLGNLVIDMPSPENRRMSEPMGAGPTCPAVGEIQPPSPTPKQLTHDVSSDGACQRKHLKEMDRPHSPSDAVLMKWRATAENASIQERKLPSPNSFLLPDPSSSALHSRGHKRAVSAPDFAPLNSSSTSQGFVPSFGPMPEPTPPLSPSAVGTEQPSLNMESGPLSPAASLRFGPQDLKCMFVDNCDTDAPLRKAISHIFGRNKLCTRLIPPAVWVHWCRKHYQRCRYRNPAEYATRQADMVSVQIDRVQMWSDENKARNVAGIVLSWTIQPRKREAQRLSEQDGGANGPQLAGGQGDDQAVANGTAIPDWLLRQCDKEFSTSQVQDVVRQIQDEMQAGYLQQIPDIEILPNISTEGGNTTKPKTTLKRKMTGGSTHKRSQSMRVGSAPAPHPMARRASHQGNYYDHHQQSASPAEKRQCVGPPLINPYYQQTQSIPPMPRRTMERIVPQMHAQFGFNHPTTLAQPPTAQYYNHAFATVSGAEPQQHNYHSPVQGPAASYHAAPTSSAYDSEVTNSARVPINMRPVYTKNHQRSQSEMGAIHHMPSTQAGMSIDHFNSRPTSSSGYPPQLPSNSFQFTAGHQAGHSLAYDSGTQVYYEQGPTLRQWSPDANYHLQPAHPSYGSQHGHGRRLSSPVVQRPYQMPRAASIAMVPNAIASEVLPSFHTLTQHAPYHQAGHGHGGAQGAVTTKEAQASSDARH